MAITELQGISRANLIYFPNLMNLKHICILFLLVAILSCTYSNKQIVDASHPDIRFENGILLYKGTPYTGDLVTYYNNKSLKSDIEYVKGQKHGAERQWFENSSRAVLRYYNKGLKSGLHQGWWENGNFRFEYFFNDVGEYNGTVKEWDKSGIQIMEFNYQNGQEIGKQRLWNADGSIKANYQVKDGERYGLVGLKKCYQVTTNNEVVD